MIDPTDARSALTHQYAQALKDHLPPALHQDERLSGIFLPNVFPEYLNAPLRVMLVGKETKGWFGGMTHLRTFASMDLYAQAAMQEWQRVDKVKPGLSKFGQFRRTLDQRLTTQAGHPIRHHWSNLLCLDCAGRSPVGHKHIDAILALSQVLIKAQLDVLKPDVLLFTTGVGSTSYDQHMERMLNITGSNFDTDRPVPGPFRRFLADGISALCTAHPRALNKSDRQATLAQILATKPLAVPAPERSLP